MGISATARETSRLRAVLVAKLQPVLFRSSQSRRGLVLTLSEVQSCFRNATDGGVRIKNTTGHAGIIYKLIPDLVKSRGRIPPTWEARHKSAAASTIVSSLRNYYHELSQGIPAALPDWEVLLSLQALNDKLGDPPGHLPDPQPWQPQAAAADVVVEIQEDGEEDGEVEEEDLIVLQAPAPLHHQPPPGSPPPAAPTHDMVLPPDALADLAALGADETAVAATPPASPSLHVQPAAFPISPAVLLQPQPASQPPSPHSSTEMGPLANSFLEFDNNSDEPATAAAVAMVTPLRCSVPPVPRMHSASITPLPATPPPPAGAYNHLGGASFDAQESSPLSRKRGAEQPGVGGCSSCAKRVRRTAEVQSLASAYELTMTRLERLSAQIREEEEATRRKKVAQAELEELARIQRQAMMNGLTGLSEGELMEVEDES